MSFQDIDELEERLGASSLAVRDLYSTWEQRPLVPDSVAVKKSGVSPEPAARQIDWMQRDPRLVARFTQCALEREEFLLACDCA